MRNIDWRLKLLTLAVLSGTVVYFSLEGVNKVEENLNEKADEGLVSALRDEFGNVYASEIEPSGEVVIVDMVASEGEIEIFDGYKTKVWNYNGQVPGPEIRVKLGDTLRVNFTNNLPDETTIHWHGVRVPNAMDGVPGVTQDPIQPGDSFVYEFTPKDAGTYWFHPHVRGSEQIERGLFGVLIVEDDTSALYSQDVVWVLDDWRLTDDYQVDPRFNTMMDLMHDGRWGNVQTVNGKLDEVLEVRPGERIRLRLLNSSNGRIYSPDFSDLDAKVIAMDGLYVGSVFDPDNLEISPGNRVDLDIKIPADAEGKEFVVYDYFSRRRNKLATIRVVGDPVQTPDFDYPTDDNVPIWDDAHKASIDKVYKLNARRSGMGKIEWTINGKAYPDYDPFVFRYNEFNKVRFVNESSRLHPMHLHGVFFKVVARNGEPVNEDYFRDTVLIHPGESVDIALVPLDKGRWVQHCHILEHAEAGMMTVTVVE